MKTLINLFTALKITLSKLIVIILAFLAPITPLLLTVGVFIVADTLMGIWKSYKLNIAINSKKFRPIFKKIIDYTAAVLLVYLLNQFIIGDFVLIFTQIPNFLTKVVATLVVSTEIFSINENYKEVYGKDLWDRVKDLIKKGKNIKDEYDEITKEK